MSPLVNIPQDMSSPKTFMRCIICLNSDMSSSDMERLLPMCSFLSASEGPRVVRYRFWAKARPDSASVSLVFVAVSDVSELDLASPIASNSSTSSSIELSPLFTVFS